LADGTARGGEIPPGIDVTKPNVARVYNYLIGGKDHFAVDRAMGDLTVSQEPDAMLSGREHRAFLNRVVRYLAAEAGVRQVIDVGSGLPTADNTHQVALRANPSTRVVYVDNDPVVVVHAQAIIGSTDTTRVIHGDIRDPQAILRHPQVREFIDFSRPVGVLLMSILHHISDAEDPDGIARAFRDAVAGGSYLAISHFCNPGKANPEQARIAAESELLFSENLGTGRWRSPAEITAFFGEFRLVDPGLVPLPDWRPDAPRAGDLAPVFSRFVGGVAVRE
jgi:SAM-dependent methyltransferase